MKITAQKFDIKNIIKLVIKKMRIFIEIIIFRIFVLNPSIS